MRNFIFTARKGVPDFGSEWNRVMFVKDLKENEGKQFRVTMMRGMVSDEMRGYMFGAVVPFLRRLVPAWQNIGIEDLYSVIKQEFNGFDLPDPLTGKLKRYARSSISRSVESEQGQEFLMRIADWVMENYAQTLPDPEEYKAMRDSAELLS